jgi:hypothetical protein
MAYPSFGAGELIFRDPDLASLINIWEFRKRISRRSGFNYE